AVDEIGTVYLQTETSNGSQILSVTQGGNTPNAVATLPIQVVAPQFGAIDGAGMLYISNANPSTIEDLITWNTVNETQGSLTIAPPLPYVPCGSAEYLTGVAADPKGDLFVIEAYCQQLFERMPGGAYAIRAILPQINGDFFWLATDSSGNAFVGSADQINELLASKTQSQLTNFGDPTSNGLAVDAADSLYVKLGNVGGVTELPASNYQTSQGLMDSLNWSGGFILGSDGSLYVGHAGTNAGAGNGNLDKVDRSKGAINFGQQTLGTPSAVQTVQLYNGGNQALTLYNVSLAGAGYGYAIQSSGSNNCVNGLVIAPGELCELAITLTALQGGTLNGTVFFSTNSVNNENSTSTVTLTASVPGPFATLTPSPLAFLNETVGTTSATASLTLSNTSNYPLDDIVLSRTGANASEFTIVPASNACGSSLPALSSCFIYLTFTPQAVGARSATLSVADNATNSPQTATLTGTGLAIPPAVINIAEVIHTTDTDVATPSTLLNIAEVIHTTDAGLATPSTLLNIAEIIHTTDAPVLKPEVTIAVAASGLAYSRVSQTYVGAVTLKNTGSGSTEGPFQILFTGLTPNVTLVNATGTILGNPYITVSAPASLAPGQSVVVNVQFKDPSGAAIHFTPQVTEGSI
ncbi:MAG: choice-of-anchor D domain-containing protein, partial [Terracidiphilus sp.]